METRSRESLTSRSTSVSIGPSTEFRSGSLLFQGNGLHGHQSGADRRKRPRRPSSPSLADQWQGDGLTSRSPSSARPFPSAPTARDRWTRRLLTHRLRARAIAWRIHQVANTGNVKPFSD